MEALATLRRAVLLVGSVGLLAAGLVVLGGACRFALSLDPAADDVAAARAFFYQRSGLGVGCILLGIVLLRLRRSARGEGE